MKNLVAAAFLFSLIAIPLIISVVSYDPNSTQVVEIDGRNFVNCQTADSSSGLEGLCKLIDGKLVWVNRLNQKEPYLLASFNNIISGEIIGRNAKTDTSSTVVQTGAKAEIKSEQNFSSETTSTTAADQGVTSTDVIDQAVPDLGDLNGGLLAVIAFVVALIVILFGPKFYNYFMRPMHVESVGHVGSFLSKIGLPNMTRWQAGAAKVSKAMLAPFRWTLGGLLSPTQEAGYKIGQRAAYMRMIIILLIIGVVVWHPWA